jgi:hypothetical protein
MSYPNAVIEQVQVKFTGRIVLHVRCPYCGHIHYNDMGYLHKHYPYPVVYRDSRCVVSLPYAPVILETSPPHLYCAYHHMEVEKVYDILQSILRQRVKTVSAI